MDVFELLEETGNYLHWIFLAAPMISQDFLQHIFVKLKRVEKKGQRYSQHPDVINQASNPKYSFRYQVEWTERVSDRSA